MTNDFPAPVKTPPLRPRGDARSKSCEHPYYRDASLVETWRPLASALGPVLSRFVRRKVEG
jgi:hypothetical protein